jgi:uncharacterized protein (TIGR03067 family)
MNQILLVTATVALLAVGVAAQDETGKAEAEKFKGTWRLVALHADGKSVIDQAKGLTFVFSGSKINMKSPDGKETEATFELDPSASPKRIDLKEVAGPNKGLVVKGIYLLDGNTMKICMNSVIVEKKNGKEFPKADSNRPTEFKGTDSVLMVFEREKK